MRAQAASLSGPGLNVNGYLYGETISQSPAEVFAVLQNHNYKWIRLPLNVMTFLDGGSGAIETLRSRLERLLDEAQAFDLAVVVAPMLQLKGSNVESLSNEASLLRYVSFVQLILNVTAGSKARVYVEVLNEPDDCGSHRWAAQQEKIYLALRQKHPTANLVVTGDCWSDIVALQILDPEPYRTDDHVMFTFHYYHPSVFVHQDTPWSSDYTRYLRGVPFPPVAAQSAAIEEQANFQIEKALPDNTDARRKILHDTRRALREYFAGRWPEAIPLNFESVTQWAISHEISSTRIFLGEFGVMGTADHASRARWIRAVALAARQNHIAWAYWALNGPFGMADMSSRILLDDNISASVTRE